MFLIAKENLLWFWNKVLDRNYSEGKMIENITKYRLRIMKLKLFFVDSKRIQVKDDLKGDVLMSRFFALFLACLACLSVSLNAAIIDFEDLYDGMDKNGIGMSVIPAGYQGLSWSENFGAYPVDLVPRIIGEGFGNGLIGNVAVSTLGPENENQVVISSENEFDFNGAYITSAFKENQDVWVFGYKDDVLLYYEIVFTSYLPASNPFSFDFQGIDKLVITPGLGGKSYRSDIYNNHIVIDDIDIVVPEPMTFCLLAAGGLAILRKVK